MFKSGWFLSFLNGAPRLKGRSPRRRRDRSARCFPGLERLENRALLSISGFVWGGLHFDASQGQTPPDTIAAAGPTHIIEAVNGNLAFINRATQVATVQATTSFFSGTHALVSDPSVSYDEATHKFIISVLDIDTTGLKETLDVAVSNGGDPTIASNWTKFTVNLTETASLATN